MRKTHLAAPLISPSEMGEKVRHFPWEDTPLGPIMSWPATLRIAVDMLLVSKLPSCLAWGPQLTTIYNDAFNVMLGRRQALGCSFDEVLGESWEQIGPIMFKALSGEATFIENFPLILNRKNSSEQSYFTFSCTPVRDESGEIVGVLDKVIETTAHVQSERQWRMLASAYEQQVQARTADLDHIWQLSSNVMIEVRPDLTVGNVNPAWSQVLGWTREEMLGMPILYLAHPEDHPWTLELVGQLQNGEILQDVESRLRHKDGHYRVFIWSAMPSNGGYTAVGRDSTQEREQEEALHEAEVLLRQRHKMEAIGQLSGRMAHDVNSLLGGVAISLTLLEQHLAQGRLERLDACIDMAKGAASQAITLVERLLAFSRHQALNPQPVDANRLIHEMTEALRQSLGPQIVLQMHLESVPWTVLVDVEQLQNALHHLCSNARDALPTGGTVIISTGNVRYHARVGLKDGLVPGDYTYVQVEDNGCGMAPEAVVRAFEPFFTSKPTGQGHGLGLSMVYGLLRQSGGRAWIESEPGKGTRVKLLLPRHLTQD